jgi:uroporphyrinogen-III synthase
VTDAGPLAGFTVGITAARRRDELASLLERRGARVVSAPSIQIVPISDDRQLLAATCACLAEPVDIVVATTGIGFRGWLEAADGWGMADELLVRLRDARIVARGPKARGAVRAAGLADEWSPDSEASDEVLSYLVDQPLWGLRVAVQLHGEPQPQFCDALRAHGADVIEVPVYRWVLPDDVSPLRRLVDQVATKQVDAVAFTSAPAATSMLRIAADDGLLDAVVESLRTDVMVACVGPVCAGPLDAHGISSEIPERARLGALVRTITERLPQRNGTTLNVAGRSMELRGHAVTYDGRLVTLPPGPLAVIRALANEPGRVMSRDELATVLPGDGDSHAVEMTVARLRTALCAPELVQTVVKRGYRLAVDSAE